MHLLLVGNDVANQELSRTALTGAGHTVAQAADGVAALLALREHPCDVVITDVLMPRMDGYRLCYEIRRDRRFESLPVIVYTSTYTSDTDEQLALDLGATRFLRHSGSSSVLLAAVHEILPAPDSPRLAASSRDLVEKLEQKNLALVRQTVALQQSELRSRLIFDAAADAMLIFPVSAPGGSDCFVDANEAATQLLGYSRAELLALTPRALGVVDAVAPQVTAASRVQSAGHLVFEHAVRTKDGRRLDTEISLRLFPSPAGQMGVAALRDITVRKRAEQVQHAASRQIRDILDSLLVAVALLSPDGTIVEVNQAPLTLSGLRREDVIGKQLHETSWWSYSPDAQSILTEGFHRAMHGEFVRFDAMLRLAPERMMAVDFTFNPLHDDDGNVLQLVASAVDITERKKLEQQFLRAQRMEAIGTLASGIAHDLNNILAPMLMAAGLLQNKLTEARDQSIVRIIENGAQRGASIVRQLLTFSRGLEGTRGSVQLRHLLTEMGHIIHETFPRNIQLERHAPADLWPVIADSTQLHQVLLNLCVNARDAMPEGGTLTLAVENLRLTADQVDIDPQARPGCYVILTVSDTGHGIPPELVARIFDPFFTTKPIGQGTGLGLSSVLGIAKSHGGFVTVASEPGRGTAFKVYIPAAETEEDAVRAASIPPFGHGELVFVVDDEDAIREAIQHLLEQNGYRVASAANGDEAVRLFLIHREAIQVVLVDMMMPVMGGLDLIRALLIIAPTLRFIPMSGLHEPDRRNELATLGIRDLLAKPCDPAHLLATLARTLATPAE